MLCAANMVQRVPVSCNIKFFEPSQGQAVPSCLTPAQRGSAHPKASQAVPNFQLRNENAEICGEISHFRVNWMVQGNPGRSTPAHSSSRRIVKLFGSPAHAVKALN